MKNLIQCDFDGTITLEDVSFLLLDKFANGNWRQVWEDYEQGRISVGTFNTRAFSMVKAGKQELSDFVLKNDGVKVRSGFAELLGNCSRRGFRFVIVSNGLDFYIEAILGKIGITGVEIFAAQSRFSPEGMIVEYRGPNGDRIDAGFKETYTRLFQREGYRVIYVGNGSSDISPARLTNHIFATSDLMKHCLEEKIDCIPFNDFDDVIKGLENLSPG